MTTYSLKFSIDGQGLQQMMGMSISISRTVKASGGNNMETAWISFQPAMQSTVSWAEDYYIYASTSPAQPGAVISLASTTNSPVQSNQLYTFDQRAVFSSSSAQTGGAFEVSNQQSPSQNWTMGLAQSAHVNGAMKQLAALNAMDVPYATNASFTPTENVSIWLSSFTTDGTVIAQTSGGALAVSLNPKQTTANIGFDNSMNSFVLKGYS